MSQFIVYASLYILKGKKEEVNEIIEEGLQSLEELVEISLGPEVEIGSEITDPGLNFLTKRLIKYQNEEFFSDKVNQYTEIAVKEHDMLFYNDDFAGRDADELAYKKLKEIIQKHPNCRFLLYLDTSFNGSGDSDVRGELWENGEQLWEEDLSWRYEEDDKESDLEYTIKLWNLFKEELIIVDLLQKWKDDYGSYVTLKPQIKYDGAKFLLYNLDYYGCKRKSDHPIVKKIRELGGQIKTGLAGIYKGSENYFVVDPMLSSEYHMEEVIKHIEKGKDVKIITYEALLANLDLQ